MRGTPAAHQKVGSISEPERERMHPSPLSKTPWTLDPIAVATSDPEDVKKRSRDQFKAQLLHSSAIQVAKHVSDSCTLTSSRDGCRVSALRVQESRGSFCDPRCLSKSVSAARSKIH